MSGFTSDMTNEELVGYVEIHCRTERGLLHKNHIRQTMNLAGKPTDFFDEFPLSRQSIVPWNEEEALEVSGIVRDRWAKEGKAADVEKKALAFPPKPEPEPEPNNEDGWDPIFGG
jgi:hypothetical protein